MGVFEDVNFEHENANNKTQHFVSVPQTTTNAGVYLQFKKRSYFYFIVSTSHHNSVHAF